MSDVTNFVGRMDWAGMTQFLLQIVAVLLCLTVHEVSHGLAAYALGDPTAKSERRLSMNPLRHIDPFGAIMMLVVGFGWGKPVPVNMRYFKHPKSGMALTALAGPISNFVLAYVALLLNGLVWGLTSGTSAPTAMLMQFLMRVASLSVGLGIFNLVPFPPLDGSKVVEAILPNRIYYHILRYERFGIFLLMAVLWFGILDGPLDAAWYFVMQLLSWGSLWLGGLFI